MSSTSRYISAAKAGISHLLISAMVGGCTALVVFGVWYKWPLHEMLQGRELFWLVVGVDVVCGPLLTLVLWNPAKPRRELVQDMALVACLQTGALLYGIHTVAIVRPVHLVFETDRIRVVSASELEATELPGAPEGLRDLPWTGPTLISVRAPHNSDELLKSVDLSMAGKEPSLRPDWWQSYESGLPQVFARARGLDVLLRARPAQKDLLDTAVRQSGMPASDLLWLPFTSAKAMEWVVLIDRKEGKPRAYAPIDGFF